MNSKVALPVGGAKGIGLAIAKRLSAGGAHVFLTSRGGEDAEKASKGIGNGAVGIVALVLNAGISESSEIADMTAEYFDRHFDVNVRGMVFGLQAALPAMTEGGSVVLVRSIAGSTGYSAHATYCAGKTVPDLKSAGYSNCPATAQNCQLISVSPPETSSTVPVTKGLVIKNTAA
ncbi:SDR family NAD(P)-dependent oxidoreductase [Rhizobium halophytocola]|uniref:NAD(P)-dependent dehydrogenase (Short-subunit alcohol dehydrogenase family) n=1 Tax=Rhizobium halophytocola TaxID=735519 RepID=A0ABS4E4J7_9HYPH|nr:SDR family oxidoreductase [Rhizobium halophytocola]MBP1852884.1 NAD(P)-dependent dehydrogenase (short-subunit alcohol dehydrogenase family) [Rhizobium halophytocola]